MRQLGGRVNGHAVEHLAVPGAKVRTVAGNQNIALQSHGVLVFIPAAITGTSVGATFGVAVPFFLILVLGLALLTYVPWISLALVHALF